MSIKSILKNTTECKINKIEGEMEWSKSVFININKNQVCWYSGEKNCLYLNNYRPLYTNIKEIEFPLSKGIKRKFSEI